MCGGYTMTHILLEITVQSFYIDIEGIRDKKKTITTISFYIRYAVLISMSTIRPIALYTGTARCKLAVVPADICCVKTYNGLICY